MIFGFFKIHQSKQVTIYTSKSLRLDSTGRKNITPKLNAFLKKHRAIKTKLVFYSGTYKIDGSIIMGSNVEIVGKKNVTLKAAGPYACMYPSFKKGYSGGIHDVSWENISFDGGSAKAFTTQMVHAKNITYRNCTFKEMQPTLGHVFDLDGSSNIKILNCSFIGRGSTVSENSSYKEAIQLDYAYYNGLSVRSYCDGLDGLPTKNVTVKNCKFLPLMKNKKLIDYAPIPIGSHSQLQGNGITDVKFTDNRIIYPLKSTSGGQATIDFLGVSNVVVKNNVIKYAVNSASKYAIQVRSQMYSSVLSVTKEDNDLIKFGVINKNVTIEENEVSGGVPDGNVVNVVDETGKLTNDFTVKDNILYVQGYLKSNYKFAQIPNTTLREKMSNKIIMTVN